MIDNGAIDNGAIDNLIILILIDKRLEFNINARTTLDVSVRHFLLQIDEKLLMGGQKQ